MSTQRKIITDEILLSGGLDSDSDEKFIQQGDYVDAMNIVSVEDSSGGVKVNIKGNEAVFTDSVSSYLCGWTYYDKNESVILFLYGGEILSKFYDKIVEFNPQTEVSTIIVTSAIDLLQFQNPKDTDYYINAKMNGDWLAWTDNVNPPRMGNIADIKDGTVTVNADYINVIKNPPLLLLLNAISIKLTLTSPALNLTAI